MEKDKLSTRKNKNGRLKKRITDFFELPREIMLNMFKVTIVGREQLIIENFTGISEYDSNKVRVNTQGGIIEIKGRNLVINEISTEDILIKGIIYSVEFF